MAKGFYDRPEVRGAAQQLRGVIPSLRDKTEIRSFYRGIPMTEGVYRSLMGEDYLDCCGSGYTYATGDDYSYAVSPDFKKFFDNQKRAIELAIKDGRCDKMYHAGFKPFKAQIRVSKREFKKYFEGNGGTSEEVGMVIALLKKGCSAIRGFKKVASAIALCDRGKRAARCETYVISKENNLSQAARSGNETRGLDIDFTDREAEQKAAQAAEIAGTDLRLAGEIGPVQAGFGAGAGKYLPWIVGIVLVGGAVTYFMVKGKITPFKP